MAYNPTAVQQFSDISFSNAKPQWAEVPVEELKALNQHEVERYNLRKAQALDILAKSREMQVNDADKETLNNYIQQVNNTTNALAEKGDYENARVDLENLVRNFTLNTQLHKAIENKKNIDTTIEGIEKSSASGVVKNYLKDKINVQRKVPVQYNSDTNETSGMFDVNNSGIVEDKSGEMQSLYQKLADGTWKADETFERIKKQFGVFGDKTKEQVTQEDVDKAMKAIYNSSIYSASLRQEAEAIKYDLLKRNGINSVDNPLSFFKVQGIEVNTPQDLDKAATNYALSKTGETLSDLDKDEIVAKSLKDEKKKQQELDKITKRRNAIDVVKNAILKGDKEFLNQEVNSNIANKQYESYVRYPIEKLSYSKEKEEIQQNQMDLATYKAALDRKAAQDKAEAEKQITYGYTVTNNLVPNKAAPTMQKAEDEFINNNRSLQEKKIILEQLKRNPNATKEQVENYSKDVNNLQNIVNEQNTQRTEKLKDIFNSDESVKKGAIGSNLGTNITDILQNLSPKNLKIFKDYLKDKVEPSNSGGIKVKDGLEDQVIAVINKMTEKIPEINNIIAKNTNINKNANLLSCLEEYQENLNKKQNKQVKNEPILDIPQYTQKDENKEKQSLVLIRNGLDALANNNLIKIDGIDDFNAFNNNPKLNGFNSDFYVDINPKNTTISKEGKNPYTTTKEGTNKENARISIKHSDLGILLPDDGFGIKVSNARDSKGRQIKSDGKSVSNLTINGDQENVGRLIIENGVSELREEKPDKTRTEQIYNQIGHVKYALQFKDFINSDKKQDIINLQVSGGYTFPIKVIKNINGSISIFNDDGMPLPFTNKATTFKDWNDLYIALAGSPLTDFNE